VTAAPRADWPEVRPPFVRAFAGGAERSSAGAVSLDRSAAAVIISAVPGGAAPPGGAGGV